MLEGNLHCHFFLLLLLSTVALPRHFDLAWSFASAQHAGIMNLFSSCTTAAAALTCCICSSVSRSTTTARALKYSPTPPTQKCHDRSYSSILFGQLPKIKRISGGKWDAITVHRLVKCEMFCCLTLWLAVLLF